MLDPGRKVRLLIYGAYGHTGPLVSRDGWLRVCGVVLGGRDKGALSALGSRLNLQTRSLRARLSAPDPYDFTAASVLEIATRIRSLSAPLGVVTPSQAFGAEFVLNLPGYSRMDIP